MDLCTTLNQHNKYTKSVLLASFLIDLFLSIGKLFTGYISSNQSILADGIHSISDVLSDCIMLYMAKIWTAPPDDNHQYGHGKIETLATVLVGVFICFIGIVIIIDIIYDIIFQHTSSDKLGLVLYVSLISIAFKEILYQYSKYCAKKINSDVLLANAKHSRSDVISTLFVVCAVIVQYYFPGFKYTDQIFSGMIVYMLCHISFKMIYHGILDLTDVADIHTENQVLQYAVGYHDIKEVHMIRSRKFSNRTFLDMHILVDPDISVLEGNKIAENFREILLQNITEIQDIVIYIEPDIAPKRHYAR